MCISIEHEISTEDMSSHGSRERLHRTVTITWQRGRRLGTSQPELLLLRMQFWRLIVAMKDSLVGWNLVHGVHSRRLSLSFSPERDDSTSSHRPCGPCRDFGSTLFWLPAMQSKMPECGSIKLTLAEAAETATAVSVA